jgi:phage gp36-like protein
VAYSAQTDVQNAVGGVKKLLQIADWNNDGNIVAAVADAIAEADALIDSYASKRFHVPFSPIPEIIKRMSAKLAALILVRRRTQMTEDEITQWEGIAGKEGWLYQLATGVVTPGGDPLPIAHSTMGADDVEDSLPDDRDASRDNLAGFW